jgi:hypothetical protein
MKHRQRREWQGSRVELNRGDYRGDFGPEGYRHFDSPPEHRGHQHHEGEYGRHRDRDQREPMFGASDDRNPATAGRWQWRRFGREGWQRGRVSGGYGSEAGAWSAGAGYPQAGFGFGREEDPGRGGFEDQDWQPTRPARGRSTWAGDWSDENYRGRGPKTYHRSDDRIHEDVCERLTDDWSVDASDIEVAVREGEVTLSGSVPSREQKWRAEDCVERVAGVREVINRIHVNRTERERQPRWVGGR